MPDCDPALSGAAIRRCEFQKALCLRRIVAAFYCDYGCDFGYDAPPVPAAAITLATTFSVAGLHIRSRDDTFCRYRTGTLRTVASTAPTTSPAASVSATARPTASPAAAMTGKSGGVIFRACTYGFRQGQFRISRSINSSIRWNLPCSSSFTNVTARPVALARAVRPMRWI